jgi:hypothetical protein
LGGRNVKNITLGGKRFKKSHLSLSPNKILQRINGQNPSLNGNNFFILNQVLSQEAFTNVFINLGIVFLALERERKYLAICSTHAIVYTSRLI